MSQQQKSEHQQFQDYIKAKKNRVEDMELNARFQVAENTTMEFAIRNEEIREKYLQVAEGIRQRDIASKAVLDAVPQESTEATSETQEVTDGQ